jgi:hypothetical protein
MPAVPMSLRDLLDLLEKLEGRVNSYWNFYSIVVFAVGGWLITKGVDAFPPHSVLTMAIGLSAFFIVNLSVIYHAERRIAAVEDEVRLSASTPDAVSSPLFRQYLQKLSIPHRSRYTFVFHLVLDISLLTLLYLKGA